MREASWDESGAKAQCTHAYDPDCPLGLGRSPRRVPWSNAGRVMSDNPKVMILSKSYARRQVKSIPDV